MRLTRQTRQSGDDAALCRAAQSGDRAAEEALIVRYTRLVRRCAHPLFLMGGDGEDLIQEGMIGLYKAIRDYESGRNTAFRSFAEMCVVRQIITAVKSATRRKHTPLNSSISIYNSASNSMEDSDRTMLDTMSAAHGMGPEETVLSKEAVGDISMIIENRLSPLEKQVLDLRLDGRSYVEIAQMICVGAKTVDNALQRVKHKLEKYYLNV